MSEWYEVFDDEKVQLMTRRAVSRVVTWCGGMLAVGTILMMLVLTASSRPILGISIIFVGLALGFGLASREMIRQRRVVWCIKLSVHRVVGYDYARRKAVLPWHEIERLDVDLAGLSIVGHARQGRTGVVLRVPTLFPEYSHLSHRVVEYAEAHGVPVCIEGRPWQLVDLPDLYPFMEIDGVVERPDTRPEDGI